ncbi:MAG: TonB-dependent receptor [Parvibaculum sp.]|nr:TonB-dependent receptor [Parvibaculum sp.]
MSGIGQTRARRAVEAGRAVANPVLLFSLVFSLAAIGSAAAAEPDQPASKRILMLEDITVTATGIGAPRATHTGNISKIDGEDVDFIRPAQPAEALNRLPGLNIQQGSGAEHLTAIRSPVLTGGAGAGSFLYLEDGVPLRAAGFANVNALMEAMDEVSGGIEVVRGPGGARYGSNAEHGLINFLSRPPSPDGDAEVSVQGGSNDSLSLTGTAGTTLRGEDLSTHGIRASFASIHDGGFRLSSGLDQQKGRLRYDFETPGTRVRTSFTAVNTNQETAGYVNGYKSYKDRARFKTNADPDAYRDAWAVRAAMRVEHDLADDLMLVLTPYARKNDMEFLMHFLPGTPTETNGHWSGGLLSSLVAGLDGGHRLIFGFDSEYTDGSLTEIQDGPTVGTVPQGVHYDYNVKALVLAPYIHSEWRLTPATSVTAGLRFEYTRYDYDNHTANNDFGRFRRIADRTDSFADVTPKIGVLHRFSDAVTGYVNIARGARAPQTADLYRLQTLQVPGEAKSEKLDSIELGARGDWRGIAYETNVFYMEKSNYYFRDAAGFNVSNGKTHHAGIEVELAAPLGAGFDIAAAASYARHTYAFDNVTPSETIHDGDDVDTAPRTLANMRLGYAFAAGAGRAELEWVHMGEYWMDAGNTVEYDGHDLFNIRLDYALAEHVSVFGKVTNLLNRRYAERADVGFAGARYFTGDDRGFFVGTSLHF